MAVEAELRHGGDGLVRDQIDVIGRAQHRSVGRVGGDDVRRGVVDHHVVDDEAGRVPELVGDGCADVVGPVGH